MTFSNLIQYHVHPFTLIGRDILIIHKISSCRNINSHHIRFRHYQFSVITLNLTTGSFYTRLTLQRMAAGTSSCAEAFADKVNRFLLAITALSSNGVL